MPMGPWTRIIKETLTCRPCHDRLWQQHHHCTKQTGGSEHGSIPAWLPACDACAKVKNSLVTNTSSVHYSLEWQKVLLFLHGSEFWRLSLCHLLFKKHLLVVHQQWCRWLWTLVEITILLTVKTLSILFPVDPLFEPEVRHMRLELRGACMHACMPWLEDWSWYSLSNFTILIKLIFDVVKGWHVTTGKRNRAPGLSCQYSITAWAMIIRQPPSLNFQ